jgi:23S rRNA-/tRNA-specific pseudouridylate synthase
MKPLGLGSQQLHGSNCRPHFHDFSLVTEDILYEDDELLVINKAAGLVVHPAPGNWNGTLVSWTEPDLDSTRIALLVGH